MIITLPDHLVPETIKDIAVDCVTKDLHDQAHLQRIFTATQER